MLKMHSEILHTFLLCIKFQNFKKRASFMLELKKKNHLSKELTNLANGKSYHKTYINILLFK